MANTGLTMSGIQLPEGYGWAELNNGLMYQKPTAATPGWYPKEFYQKEANPYAVYSSPTDPMGMASEKDWYRNYMKNQAWGKNPTYAKIPEWQAANEYTNDWQTTYGLPFDQWYWLNNPVYSPNVQLPQNTVVQEPNNNINLGNITAPGAGGTTTPSTGGITSGATTPVEQALVDYINAQTGAANAQTQAQQGFDIPTDKFPTTTSYSGLPPELMTQLQEYIDKANPMLEQYAGVLKNASSPASFISANKPVQQALVNDIINDLAQRGILRSTDASQAITDASAKVPQAYMQNLISVAQALQGGAALPLAGINAGKVSTSETSNPLAPYELMLQALGMM